MRVRATGATSIILGSFLTFCSPLIADDALATGTTGVDRFPTLPLPSRRLRRHHRSRIGLHGKIAATVAPRGVAAAAFPVFRSRAAIRVSPWLGTPGCGGTTRRACMPGARSRSRAACSRSSPTPACAGHVAVVSRIINSREVEIDQANWWGAGMRGGIAHNVPVVDVSEANDWSAVRVGLGRSGDFGSVYPTYGFIYDRPDNGVEVAAATAPSPQPALNPAPRDLRPAAERPLANLRGGCPGAGPAVFDGGGAR